MWSISKLKQNRAKQSHVTINAPRVKRRGVDTQRAINVRARAGVAIMALNAGGQRY